jgi:hypothetical protein
MITSPIDELMRSMICHVAQSGAYAMPVSPTFGRDIDWP